MIPLLIALFVISGIAMTGIRVFPEYQRARGQARRHATGRCEPLDACDPRCIERREHLSG